jgi:hypothetical protein
MGKRFVVALVVGLAGLVLAAPGMGATFQQFVLQTGTPLVGDDFDYALADWEGYGKPDLFAIKRRNTGTGMIEVHVLSGRSNYQQFVLHTGTPLGPLGDDFKYAVADWDGDRRPDLFAIKHRNTGTGMVEVHILSGRGGFQQFLLQTGTPLGPLGDDFDYAVADWNQRGKPDLIAIKHRNTGTGTVEVHVLSGESNFQQFVLQTATPLTPLGDDFAFGIDDWNFDGKPDLVAIKRTNTGTGTIEAHGLLGPWFQQFAYHTGTPLGPLGDDFQYALADYNGDRNADLYAIKRRNSGTGTIEAHVLAAPTPTPPAPPSGLTLIGHTSSSLRFQWTDNETGAHGAYLERQDGSGWKEVSGWYPYTGQPTTVTDNSPPLAANTTYCYRAKADNYITGLKSYSPTVCATTDPLPPNLFIPAGAIWTTYLNDPFTSFSFIHAGDAFSIAWGECNNGQASAAGHQSTLLLRATGQSSYSPVGTVQVPVLAPGACVRAYVQFPYGLFADQYDAAIAVDSANAVAEATEVDNLGLMGFNILQ